MLVLLGIVVIVFGFVLRLNPLLVVMAAAAVPALLAGFDLHAVISAFGKAFNDTRYVRRLDRAAGDRPAGAPGLQERARDGDLQA